MFEVTVSDEFAHWFASLEGRDVEEVASALDVLAALGPALDPVKASRLLLWFDGTLSDAMGSLDEGLGFESALASERLEELMLWQREVTRCLDSPEFGARLAGLDAATCTAVLAAIERVQHVVRAARELESLRALIELSAGGPLSRETVRYLRGASGGGYALGKPSTRPRELIEALKTSFFAVLELAGLDPKQIRDPASGLREVTIRGTNPRLRILYGIDVPQKRLIVLVGEALTRAYYGDSVRFAERRFREFMLSDSPAVEMRA